MATKKSIRFYNDRKVFMKGIIPVLVTNSSAKRNEYYNQLIYNNITLKNLFA